MKLLYCLILLAAPLWGQMKPALIRLHPEVKLQKMTGWEATLVSQIVQNPAWPIIKDQLLDSAVNDLGLNRVRLEIRSGSENPRDAWSEWVGKKLHQQLWRCLRYATINDDDDPFHINPAGFHYSELDYVIENQLRPIQQRLEAKGEKLFVNVNYVGFYEQLYEPTCPAGLQYIHTEPEEYAEFVLAAYLHMKEKYGLIPDTWEIELEPDNTRGWRGKLIGQTIVAAAKRLRENGFQPAFIAPSTTAMDNAVPYFDDMIQVPGALDSLAEFSYHRYRGVSDENLRAIGERAVRYHVKTSMLEHIGSGYEDLHSDIEIGHNSAWQQFVLASIVKEPNAAIREWIDTAVSAPILEAAKSGDRKAIENAVASAGNAVFNRLHYGADAGAEYYTIETREPGHPRVIMGNRSKFLRQYFKFIRRDAQRIGAESSMAALDPLAFINKNGNYVSVIKADRGMSFSVAGLPGGLYGIKYTTANRYDFDLPEVRLSRGKTLSASIPAAGVITVYAK